VVKMKILVIVAFLAGAFASSIDDVDFENQRNGRIWGGREAVVGELPYQVGLVIALSGSTFCGGSIVSENFVLTAARCFPSVPPRVLVEIGSIDRNAIIQFIIASDIITHELFDLDNSDHDIALVRTSTPIQFSATVGLVRLPNRRQVEQTFENQQARISGWGSTGLGSTLQRFLRVGFGQVISQTACRVRFPATSSGLTLCIDGSDVNFCTGDFGGPVTITDADQITTQIGVKSFNSPIGCTHGWPGGFTRTSMYLDWIAEHSDVVIRDDF